MIRAFGAHCHVLTLVVLYSPQRRLFDRFLARGHQSEIMLGVLVVVFCPDYIAGLGLGLG
jgi:hypothetical protein